MTEPRHPHAPAAAIAMVAALFGSTGAFTVGPAMPTGIHAAGLPAVRAATTSGASAWSAVPARAASSRLAPLAWSGRRHALGVRRLFMRAETTPKEFVMYNTLARDKQPFKPIADDGKTVKMYTCGPTIYDFAHIGNFRAFLTYDLLKRWLTYCGYDVDHVCNLTDIDDKIIARMKRDDVSLKDLTNKFAEFFFEDLDSLNIVPARCYPRATDHVDEIVEMIDGLVKKGHAYEKDGSFYFDVGSFPSYGQLARLDFDNMQDGAGEGGGLTDPEAFTKKNSRDFALWKAYKAEDGAVVWDTKIGKGRPGWHIECSAMSRRYLGDSFDIHAGGVDLTFPHHENEIAQSEAFCGCKYCNFWVHNGFVNIDNEKMSKSLGNFRTLREACKDALDIRAFRYLVISAQYRAGLNFTPDVLKSARKTVSRLDKFRANLRAVTKPDGGASVRDLVSSGIADFERGMADDLNTPRACAALFGLVKGGERLIKADSIDKAGAGELLEALTTMDSILGVFYDVPGREEEQASKKEDEAAEAPAELIALLQERVEAKKAKDFARADAIRDQCAAAGFKIVDSKEGSSLQRA